jgi:DNA polymerase type B, organellar and viral
MLTDNYNGYTFYVHNLAKYDNFYIIPILFKCVNSYPEIYDYKFIFRDNYIIGIKISKKVKIFKKEDTNLKGKKSKKGKKVSEDNSKEFYFKTYSIRIVDSYTILSAPLDELCVTFNTNVKKSIFPYTFVHRNNLFYIGNKPSRKFFVVKQKDNTTNTVKEEILSIDEYKLIKSENWSVKEETLSYLEKDLISLFQVIDKFNNKIYNEYGMHIVESLTISGLTMNIFLRNYYKNNIPLIKQKSVYNNLKKSYYGGITEVYRPYGKGLYLYDVNSLYPFAALNPMPGLECIYKDNINKDFGILKDNIFGFFNCKITAPAGYLGLLPYRTKSGLISPVGTFEGYYFSEELKFAYENGYEITVLSGYQFSKSENVFNSYVKDLYEVKSNTKDNIIRAITKSFLNNLLGR